MKKFIALTFFSLFSLAAFCQTEVAKGDNASASQSTRLRLGANTDHMGQTNSAGVFKPFVLDGEALGRNFLTPDSDTLAPPSAGIRFGLHPVNGRIGIKMFGTGNRFQTLAYYSDVSALFPAINAKLGFINGEAPPAGGDFQLSTSKVPEGSNLYFTNARADARVQVVGDARYVQPTGIIPYASVVSYSALAGVAIPPTGSLKFINVTTDERYGESDALYYITSSGKIRKVQTLKEN